MVLPASFTGGASEILRAMLMLSVGAEPEGLTEATRQVLAAYQPLLTAPDLLGMLKLAAETEAGLRRAANPRLAVETLLLRWTLSDRTVNIEEVLQGASAVRAARRQRAPAPVPGPSRPSSDPPRPRPRLGRIRPAAAGPVRGEFTLDGLLGAWNDLVAAARSRTRFLGEALASASTSASTAPASLASQAGWEARQPQGPTFEEKNKAILDDAKLKEGLKVFWFATGKDDFLVGTTRATVEMFKKHQFQVIYKETEGAHTWDNWREYLNEFAPKLFQ